LNQLNNSSTTSSQTFHNNQEDVYTYNGSRVKVITVFSDLKGPIALVEDENGELFEVAKDSLR